MCIPANFEHIVLRLCWLSLCFFFKFSFLSEKVASLVNLAFARNCFNWVRAASVWMPNDLNLLCNSFKLSEHRDPYLKSEPVHEEESILLLLLWCQPWLSCRELTCACVPACVSMHTCMCIRTRSSTAHQNS